MAIKIPQGGENVSPIQNNLSKGSSSRAAKKNPIPDDFLEQIKERADIVSVISRSVQLKKSGSNNLVGLCPFHSEKSPSFSVSPSKGMYYCFGCGASGSAITFLMEHDGTPFREAVMELASSAGLALPQSLVEEGQQPGEQVDTTALYQSMEMASQFFGHILRHDQTSRAYLKKRQLSIETVQKFRIGAAPDEWRSLSEAFPDYGSNTHILECGLVKEKESQDNPGQMKRYDTFRGRIIFPVRDTRGRIIAFGGRIVGEGDPKYLNSPETPIFNKSNSLYGLFEARESIRQKKMAIVVEGYIDVAMLSQSGIENVVACMGTNMTRMHVERLLTQSNAIAFAFDGDSAGRRAAWKAMVTCIPLVDDEHDVRFLILPPGKDPDDLANLEGASAFDERVRKAPSLSDFLISELSLKHNGLANTEDRARFAAEGHQVAEKLNYHSKLRSLLLQRITEESRMPGSVIKSLQNASRSRPMDRSIWSLLSAAAKIAPSVAIAERDLLLELLDTSDARENLFATVLSELPLPQAATESESPEDPSWLLARDTLNSAVQLIEEHRGKQILAHAKTQFQQGEITELEYLRMSLAS